MKEVAKIWIGATLAAMVYLTMCGIFEAHEARQQQCSVVRCV